MTDSRDKPFATTQIVCGVVLKKDGKYLLVQEKKVPVRGKWSFPAGRVDPGETLEAAAVREAQEETGLDVRLDGGHFVIHQRAEQPVLHAFSATIIGGELRFPKSEILDVRWFSHQELEAMKAALRSPDFVLGAVASLHPQVQ